MKNVRFRGKALVRLGKVFADTEPDGKVNGTEVRMEGGTQWSVPCM